MVKKYFNFFITIFIKKIELLCCKYPIFKSKQSSEVIQNGIN